MNTSGILKFVIFVILTINTCRHVFSQQVIYKTKSLKKIINNKATLVVKLNVSDCSNQLSHFKYIATKDSSIKYLLFLFGKCNDIELLYINSYMQIFKSTKEIVIIVGLNNSIFAQFSEVQFNSAFRSKKNKLEFYTGGYKAKTENSLTDSNVIFKKYISSNNRIIVKMFENKIGLLIPNIGLFFIYNSVSKKIDSFYINIIASKQLESYYFKDYDSSNAILVNLERKKIFPESNPFFAGETEVSIETFEFLTDSTIFFSGTFKYFLLINDTFSFKTWYLNSLHNLNSAFTRTLPLSRNNNYTNLYILSKMTVDSKSSDKRIVTNYSLLPLFQNIYIDNDSNFLFAIRIITNTENDSQLIQPINLNLTLDEYLKITKKYSYRLNLHDINSNIFMLDNYPKPINIRNNSVKFEIPETDTNDFFFLKNIQYYQNGFYMYYINNISYYVVKYNSDYQNKIIWQEHKSKIPLFINIYNELFFYQNLNGEINISKFQL